MWSSRIRAEKKPLMKRRTCKSSWGRMGRLKWFVFKSEWKLMGRFHGVLHLSAKRHRSTIRWENAFWKTFGRQIVPFGSLVEYHPLRRISQTSINLERKFSWIVPRIRSLRGGNLERWRTDCMHCGVGYDGCIGNLLWKTQREGSGIENTHSDTRTPNSRRRRKRFFCGIRRVFHHFWTHFWMPVKRWTISGPCREASYTAITLNHESNFTRREKNHSLFHWNTLT